MSIKVDFWKWKRAIRRNKKIISRTISITLAALLVIGVGYLALQIHQNDIARAEAAANGIDKSPIKSQSKDYGEAGFHQVAENALYTLSADYTTGEIVVLEKSTGKQWYSNPPERANDNYCAIKTRLNSQIHVNFLDLDNCTMQTFDNYGASIRKGGMEHKLIENGIKFTYAFPATGSIIPVQYTLCEDGLLAEIVADEIQELWTERYIIESINFLPFFGAGGLEDDGYLFVPDGSGSLIDFNNNKQKNQSFSGQVYGTNLVLEKTQESTMVRENISMPVFGEKCNDNAFFAIILSGDANSTISATTSKKTSSYNQVYATAIIRELATKQMAAGGKYEGQESSSIYDSSDNLLEGKNYAVKYFFLDKEDADYTGMSKCYRDYLSEQNLLNDSALAEDKYLVLDLIGAVSIEKYVMGIKTPVVTALTTYNDVCEIVKELKAGGVDKLIVNYVGALDSGLNNKMFSKVATESVLGSKKEFRNMIQYLEDEGVILFLETNPVDLHQNGNGYKTNKDGTKTFFNSYGFQYKYELDDYKYIKSSRWHLLTPQKVPGFVSNFADSALNWNVNNVSLDRLGTSLYSNYAEGEDYTSRTQAQTLWADALKAASEKADNLMVHGGNAYCVPYADVITDVSSSSSAFDMADQNIPFYQLTFQGNMVLTAEAINTTVDYEYAFLKALETGCSLKFNLMNSDVSDLVGTDYNDMTSYSYDYWKDIVVDEYLEMQKAVQEFAGKQIVKHEYLENDVTLTAYESAQVIVNYGDDAYSYNGTTVEARDYLILSGGAK